MEAATEENITTETGPPAPPPRLRDRYESEILPALIEKFGYSSSMAAPRLTKITVNMGIGQATDNKAIVEHATEQLAAITGQHPNTRRARKSIANFKLREGMPVGLAVTLRRAKMWEFLDRFVTVAAPRIRDFRGFSARTFDGRGNCSIGVKEQLIFPEIDYDAIDMVRGLDIAFTTTAKTDVEGFELMLALGIPFSKEGRPGEADAAAEEEEARRHEEARIRAEAEQAALEQLKEENPDAYAKPEPAEDEDGEDGDSSEEE